jgi:uncharacterized membrane protein YphA (DoxX/SURF4 family)
LRCGLALVFAFHGYPKLFGKTAVFVSAFERLGLPGYLVYIVGVIEVFGALMLMLGLYTPVAALLLLLESEEATVTTANEPNFHNVFTLISVPHYRSARRRGRRSLDSALFASSTCCPPRLLII